MCSLPLRLLAVVLESFAAVADVATVCAATVLVVGLAAAGAMRMLWPPLLHSLSGFGTVVVVVLQPLLAPQFVWIVSVGVPAGFVVVPCCMLLLWLCFLLVLVTFVAALVLVR